MTDAIAPPLNLFVLSDDLITAMGYEEVHETIAALAECGLLKLPYPQVSIKFNVDAYGESPGWMNSSVKRSLPGKLWITVVVTQPHIDDVTDKLQCFGEAGVLLERDSGESAILNSQTGETVGRPELGVVEGAALRLFQGMSVSMAALLIAALATKNTTKQTTYNKRAAKGYGAGLHRSADGRVYVTRTVLDLPAHTPTPTGRRMPFHLRRGHVHTFWAGPNRDQMRKHFLPPIFVNSDLQDGPVKAREYEVRE